MRSVRPRASGPGQGHHDLHAADEVHVHQHDELGAHQQETESCLADVELAILIMSDQPSLKPHQPSPVIIVLGSVQLEKPIIKKISTKTFWRFILIVSQILIFYEAK